MNNETKETVEFDETYYWSILANKLDIQVDEEEVNETMEELKEKDLWDGKNYESEAEKMKENLSFRTYYSKDELEEEIKKKKLEKYLYGLAFDVAEDMGYSEQDVRTIRSFVKQHVQDSKVESREFFEKLNELDDYLFLKFLSKNISHLWW